MSPSDYVSENAGHHDQSWLADMLSYHPSFRASEFAWEDAVAWLQRNPEKMRELSEILTRVVRD
jgi:hypothetical protein